MGLKNIRPRLAEGGKIKTGGLGELRTSKKTGKEFRMPVKYEHFIITKTTRDQATGNFEVDHALMNALPKDEYGQVREIPIVVHSDEIDEVFPTAYAAYEARNVYCIGDGETATVKSTGVSVACPCDRLNGSGTIICKPHGTLHCSIALADHAVAGMVYKWRTTSIISIEQMLGSLQQIKSVVGTIKGVPLTLTIRPLEVRPQGKPATVYVCHVELRAADMMQVQRAALENMQRRKALGAGDLDLAYKLLVESPAENLEDEEQQEYYPELVDPDTVFDQNLENGDPVDETDYQRVVEDMAAALGKATTEEELFPLRAKLKEIYRNLTPEQVKIIRVAGDRANKRLVPLPNRLDLLMEIQEKAIKDGMKANEWSHLVKDAIGKLDASTHDEIEAVKILAKERYSPDKL